MYIFNFSRYHKMFFFFMTFKLGHGVGLWVLSPNIYIIASDRPWSQCGWHGWGLSVSLSSNCHPELKMGYFLSFLKSMRYKKGTAEAEISQGYTLYKLFPENHIIIMTSILESVSRWWFAVWTRHVRAALGWFFKAEARAKGIGVILQVTAVW